MSAVCIDEGRKAWWVRMDPPHPDWPPEEFAVQADAMVAARLRRFATGWPIAGVAPSKGKRRG